MKAIRIFIMLMLPAAAFAQETAAPASNSGNFYMEMFIAVLILTAIILLLFSFTLLKAFKVLSAELSSPAKLLPETPGRFLEWDEWHSQQKAKPGVVNKLLGLKPIEEEMGLLMDHKFDGIGELDNPVPTWFNVMFYGTIVIGILYFIAYHVTGWGMLQEQEYAVEMKQAKIEQTAYLAKSANNIDENSVKESKETAVLSAGQAIFSSSCVACHGDKGQGIVGPNLTDEYWLHGGKVGDVFKTIKYGVPEKGMISWEKTLSPKQISEVTNYILSLKGSAPANPKAPQGEKEG